MGKPGARNNRKIKNANNPKEYYNIIFLGPTGVGKSTFINSFVNYLSYDTMDKAKENEKIVLIESKFTIFDENLVQKVVSISGRANAKNESGIVGDSATQESKVYTFPILGTDKMLRMLDTPGIGDTRGIKQDETNCDDILRKISQYDVLHAICILLKPNNARITAEFEFCLNQLLSRLEKSASQNIIFVFTNSRGTSYRPGDTFPALQRVLQNIKEKSHVDVPLKPENVFCLDNEAFRYLMAVKDGITFPQDEVELYEKSWNISRNKCLR